MTNNMNRDMQEAVDETLHPDAYRKLQEGMKQNPEAAADYKKLQSAERLLRDARPRKAPSSLMDGIMAAIAEPEALPAPQPLISGRALAIGLGVAAAVALPLLTLLSLGILSIFGAGSALSGFALGVIGVVMFLYALVTGTISGARDLMIAFPLLPALLLLIPAAWYGLWRLGRTWKKAE
ncbi:MAG: hypothetical protein AAF787_03595 [Chloroflexota bacterium]